jgi:hypothetical protein
MIKLLVVLWGRARGRLPMTFKCDCGWRFRYGRFEHERWNEIHTITCHECGDIYRVFQNTIVRIIPNPLHRCLRGSESTGGVDPAHPYARYAFVAPAPPSPLDICSGRGSRSIECAVSRVLFYGSAGGSGKPHSEQSKIDETLV